MSTLPVILTYINGGGAGLLGLGLEPSMNNWQMPSLPVVTLVISGLKAVENTPGWCQKSLLDLNETGLLEGPLFCSTCRGQ